MADISKIILPDGSEYNLKDSTSGYITGMTILSYGSSSWTDFLAAYQAQKVVYCRASSNSNPASGSQTRLAFMAYVNNATNPTEVEFQYYRSVNSHNANQQGDQVYVYKLTSANKWTVTVRESYSKVAAGTGLTSSYASGTITLSSSYSAATTTEDGLMSAEDKTKLEECYDALIALRNPSELIDNSSNTLVNNNGDALKFDLDIYDPRLDF